jgi:hypothetical protein
MKRECKQLWLAIPQIKNEKTKNEQPPLISMVIAQ